MLNCSSNSQEYDICLIAHDSEPTTTKVDALEAWTVNPWFSNLCSARSQGMAGIDR